MPDSFELSVVQTRKSESRTVDGQGRISFSRYWLYVRAELKGEKVSVREFCDSLVVTYQEGAVVSYECTIDKSRIESVKNTPLFHEHSQILDTAQLELFDPFDNRLRYVKKRAPFRRSTISPDATQLLIFDQIDSSPKDLRM